MTKEDGKRCKICMMEGSGVYMTNGKDVGYCRTIGNSMGISVLSQYITQLDLRLVAVRNLLNKRDYEPHRHLSSFTEFHRII